MMEQDLLEELRRRGIKLRLAGDQLDVIAPTGTLTPDLRHRLQQERDALIGMLRRTATPTDTQQITPAPAQRHEPFPLTPVQHAYWVGRAGGVELGGVFTHFYLELEGDCLDAGRLTASLNKVIARHDMLRAVIDSDGRQRILPQTPPYEIAVTELAAVSDDVRTAELDHIRSQMSHRSLPPERWPLFEIAASTLPDGRLRLHLNFDNVITDAVSLDVIFRDWKRFYADPDWTPEPLNVSFRDYVLAQETRRKGSGYADAEAYWSDRLNTLPSAPALPVLQRAAQLCGPQFTHRHAALSPDQWSSVKQAARRRGLTPSAVVMTAFTEVLRLWSRQPDFTLNLTLFNRQAPHPQLGQVVGDFTSLVLLEAAAPPEDESFTGHARRLSQQLMRDLEHLSFDGVRVLQERARRSGGAPAAAMPVVFSSGLAGDDPGHGTADARLFFGQPVYSLCETPQVWLDHQVSQEQGALRLDWDAVEQLFPDGLLDSMFAAYVDLIGRLARDDAAWDAPGPLATLPDWQSEDRRAANDTASALAETTLGRLVEEQISARPGALAVAGGDGGTLTYGELGMRARRLARRLIDAGAARDTLVGIVLDKGTDQAVAVLGAIGSGAAYLPIDPQWPQARRDHLLIQGRARIVVTSPELRDLVSWPPDTCVITPEDPEVTAAEPVPLDVVAAPRDLAYVIFTSGSTGTPKGVMIEHAAAANTIQDINQRFDVGPGDVILALSALTFDLSVYDIFGALAAGATCVIPSPAQVHDPASWTRLTEHHGVTIWNSVPALMQAWLDGSGDEATRPSLRLAMLSGDWIPVSLPAAVRARCPRAALVSLGGATEAAIWSISYPIGDVPPHWDRIPYGKPLANQRMHVLDYRFRDVPVWVTGEIYIGGAGLARGYWADENKTGEQFITHPVTGERLYRTGDLGRYLPGGDIEFLGRKDSQVKLNGYRIELGEIAAAMRRVPGVAEALVTVAANPATGGRQLVGYVLPESGPYTTDLQAALKETLPDYMVPRHYMVLDEIPLSANAKVDISRLPVPWRAAADAQPAAADDELENKLLEIWSETLGRDDFGVADNLFELGGDSLHAVRILGRVRDEFGIEGSAEEGLQLIFASPTIAELATTIREMTAA
jgi:pyochelin synthetase